MTKKLQHWFPLSEKGARDLVRAVFWCFVCNLALMLPIGAVLFTAQHLLACLEGGGSPMNGFWIYVGFALAVLLLLFVLHWFQYASLYIATYRESANRRVSLAETLRRLPLSFFGNRDLSDLTATMIADCSSLDQMFSHYVPQLFAAMGSTLVIGVCMFAFDWRMALAVLWVVPVAVALTAGSKKIQDAFGTKNILNKRAVADCIQEGLETIRDIKACHRQERYLGDLEEKLAARFWDVTGGKVSLGGTDVSTVDPETLLGAYSMVFQDVVLFRDTVMENIRLGHRGATDEEVLEAAKAAQCDAFIRKLPQGYQTVIGENGATLSGGERQRISIARALLKDAPVVLLDEATASLDVENESAVQAALSRLLQGKTVLVIAHRMRTVAGADHIVVLEDGHVAQQGTPAELMEQGGLYRRMVELQRESAQWQLGEG